MNWNIHKSAREKIVKCSASAILLHDKCTTKSAPLYMFVLLYLSGHSLNESSSLHDNESSLFDVLYHVTELWFLGQLGSPLSAEHSEISRSFLDDESLHLRNTFHESSIISHFSHLGVIYWNYSTTTPSGGHIRSNLMHFYLEWDFKGNPLDQPVRRDSPNAQFTRTGT